MIIKYISHDPNKKMLLKTVFPKLSLTISSNCWAFNALIINEDDYEPKSNYYVNYLDARLKSLNNSNIATEIIHETVLYLLYPQSKNYSHFTLQCMSGFLQAQKAGLISDKLKIAVDQSLGFQKEICSLYGLNSQQIIYLDPNILYKFDEVIYSDSLFYNQLDDKTYSLYENIGHKFYAGLDFKLYITRHKDTIRSTINEDAIIELMKQNGFLVVDFALIPVHMQIALIQNAKVICAAHGASGANLVYKDKNKFKFIEYFSPMWPSECHARILNIKNCDYSPVMGSALQHHMKSPIRIDINLLKQALGKTVHSFSFTADRKDEVDLSRGNLNSKINNLINVINNRKVAQKNIRRGNYKKFIEYLNYTFNQALDSYGLGQYYEACFLAFDKYSFQKMTLQLCKTGLLGFDTILDYCLKGCLFPLFKYIVKKYNLENQPAIKNILGCYYNFIINLPSSALLSWHNTVLAVDMDNMKLITSSRPDNLVILRGWGIGATASLYVPQKNKYIEYINEDGSITLASSPANHNMIKHNSQNLSIKMAKNYLSAINDGSVRFASAPCQWERFFVIK